MKPANAREWARLYREASALKAELNLLYIDKARIESAIEAADKRQQIAWRKMSNAEQKQALQEIRGCR